MNGLLLTVMLSSMVEETFAFLLYTYLTEYHIMWYNEAYGFAFGYFVFGEGKE